MPSNPRARMLSIYAINASLTAISALTITSRASLCRSVRSSSASLRYHIQSIPKSCARVTKLLASAINGIITILIEPPGPPSPSRIAGSRKKILLPLPVGSTIISMSLRVPLLRIAIIRYIPSRCCSDFQLASSLSSRFSLRSIFCSSTAKTELVLCFNP
jgi:hypothetical protein